MEEKFKVNKALCAAIKKKMIGRKQTWLAKEIGMTDTALSNRINGVFPFRTNEVQKIAKVLDDESLIQHNIFK